MSDPTSESVMTDAVLAANLKAQQEKGPDLRQVHSKSHGCVWGEFTVTETLPDSLKVGIFANAQTYPAWVRFSNGSEPEKRGKLKSDREPDARGLAIKLMNVEGEKVLDDEEKTQDFILLNHPVFFVRNVQGYIDLARASTDPEVAKAMQPTFAILQQIGSKTVTNPLHIEYWSTTPYKLGNQAIKFSVKPHTSDTGGTIPDSENYLREAMVAHLSEQDAQFDFLVQRFVDEEKTPIEDPMQEWKAEDAPYLKVATLRIPSQVFDFEERKRLDEGLSFSPWHTLPDHEPLGSVNLARKKIYQTIAQARRDTIQQRLREPSPHSQ
ncbi:catalase family protein [Phormidesmis sp. 146-33]